MKPGSSTYNPHKESSLKRGNCLLWNQRLPLKVIPQRLPSRLTMNNATFRSLKRCKRLAREKPRRWKGKDSVCPRDKKS